MHDPLHVAFEIRWPFPRRESWRRPRLLVIWHRDPERDGSDDSCSTRKRLSIANKSLIECVAGEEARHPWFLRERAKEPSSPADAEALLRGALWNYGRMLKLDRWSLWHRRLTLAKVERLACELIHCSADNVRSSLCLLPGWHTNDRNPDGPPATELDIDDADGHEREYNRPADDVRYPQKASEWGRRNAAESFVRMIVRILSRHTALWWQEPKWHVHHWRLQFPLWQWFRRRFIERCSICRKKYRGRSDVYSGFQGGETWCGDCQGAKGGDRG